MFSVYKKSSAHLCAVNESYARHFCFAMRFFARLLTAAAIVLIHALVPALFEKTGSRMIGRLYAELQGRGGENV